LPPVITTQKTKTLPSRTGAARVRAAAEPDGNVLVVDASA